MFSLLLLAVATERSAQKIAPIVMTAKHSWVARASGRVLRRYRKLKGLSQEDLAGEAGFDRTYPSLLERGLRTPTLSAVIELARALGVSVVALVKETEEELRKWV